MVNILHAIDTPGPGGAETVFVNLINGLDRERFKSHAVIPSNGWLSRKMTEIGVRPYLIESKGSFNLRYLFSLIKLIKRLKIDIVQSHLLGSNVYCSMAGFLCGIPVVSTFHGFVDVETNDWLMRLKTGLINTGTKKIVFVSNRLRKDFNDRYKLSIKKSVTIYNGIDAKVFTPKRNNLIRQTLGFSQNQILIGSVGNIRPAKGYDSFLCAARLVVNEHQNCRFLITGEKSGFLYEYLLRKRHRLNLEKHFKFLGYYDNVQEFLNGIDIFVLPSISEGFSIVTIEAMSCGVPVIVSRSGGPEEIVTDAKTGLFFNAGDAKDLASVIEILLKRKELRKRISVEGMKTAVNKFSIEKMIAKYQSLYFHCNEENKKIKSAAEMFYKFI